MKTENKKSLNKTAIIFFIIVTFVAILSISMWQMNTSGTVGEGTWSSGSKCVQGYTNKKICKPDGYLYKEYRYPDCHLAVTKVGKCCTPKYLEG